MVEALVETINGVREQVANYIVTPLAQYGVGGFVFDVEGENNTLLESDITDHYTEENIAVQDHIAIRPKIVMLDTYVGELVFNNSEDNPISAQEVAQKLTILNSYLPPLTSALEQAQALINQENGTFDYETTANEALDIYSFIKNSLPPINKQQQAYQYFKALMDAKVLVSVQTPFEFCTNMAIQSITAKQGEGSTGISQFSIVLKEFRTVATQIIDTPLILQGRAALQNQAVTNGGKIQGQQLEYTTDIFQ